MHIKVGRAWGENSPRVVRPGDVAWSPNVASHQRGLDGGRHTHSGGRDDFGIDTRQHEETGASVLRSVVE